MIFSTVSFLYIFLTKDKMKVGRVYIVLYSSKFQV